MSIKGGGTGPTCRDRQGVQRPVGTKKVGREARKNPGQLLVPRWGMLPREGVYCGTSNREEQESLLDDPDLDSQFGKRARHGKDE